MYLFLHGLIGSSGHWTSVVRLMPKTECCVCDAFTDYLHHDVNDVADFYRPMLAAARRRGEPVTVVGNSLGCVTGLHLLDVADAVVLTAPPFDFDQSAIPLAKGALDAYVRALLAKGASIENQDALVGHACSMIEALMASRQGLRRIRSLKRQAQSFVTSGLLAEAGTRATVMIGAEDFTTPLPEFKEFLRRAAPQARLRVLPECGHAVPLEKSDEVAAVLQSVRSAKMLDAVS
jgi:pimeloyl-ACP methyl ester carboxylesterase